MMNKDYLKGYRTKPAQRADRRSHWQRNYEERSRKRDSNG